jgi:prepilin-type N-terminal cleavage/methylation domain-containing protein
VILDRASGPAARRPGFTLTEMLVVMFALGMVMLFGMTLIMTTIQAERAGEAGANRVTRRADLGAQFRTDVAQAEAAPDKLVDVVAGPTTLILRRPGGAAVVYCWEKNTLERTETTADQKTSRRPVPVGVEGTAVEFVRPKEKEPGVVVLRITDPPGPKPSQPRWIDIAAALGGNLR